MNWTQFSPYFHAVVWSFNLTLFAVWLWELRARNVTLKNIPAAFLLMTVSLALALLNSFVFLVIGGTHELDIGGESTRQWMCALCGIFAIVGQYLVRVSVWAFFVVRGSLVTSFNPRLNRIARATPYVLSAHAFLFVVLCALFVDVKRGHGGHSQMCHLKSFPVWLLFVGPMAGDLFYSVGFFVIFYKAIHSTFLHSVKALSTRDRIATQRHLRQNLALFVLQLSATAGFYVLIVSTHFSFISFELCEMNAVFTNLCLFALFQGRAKLYPCCSRVLCPKVLDAEMRQEQVNRELRGGRAQRRRQEIDAIRQKEREMESRRLSPYGAEINNAIGERLLEEQMELGEMKKTEENIEENTKRASAKGIMRMESLRVALPLVGEHSMSVFRNSWNAGDACIIRMPSIQSIVTAHALGKRIVPQRTTPTLTVAVGMKAAGVSTPIGTTPPIRRPMPLVESSKLFVKPGMYKSGTKPTSSFVTKMMTSSASAYSGALSMSSLSETQTESDTTETGFSKKTPTLAVPMDAFANVLESELLRCVTISSKAGKLLGVCEALVGVESTDRRELFRNITDHSTDASALVSEYREKSRCKERSRRRHRCQESGKRKKSGVVSSTHLRLPSLRAFHTTPTPSSRVLRQSSVSGSGTGFMSIFVDTSLLLPTRAYFRPIPEENSSDESSSDLPPQHSSGSTPMAGKATTDGLLWRSVTVPTITGPKPKRSPVPDMDSANAASFPLTKSKSQKRTEEWKTKEKGTEKQVIVVDSGCESVEVIAERKGGTVTTLRAASTGMCERNPEFARSLSLDPSALTKAERASIDFEEVAKQLQMESESSAGPTPLVQVTSLKDMFRRIKSLGGGSTRSSSRHGEENSETEPLSPPLSEGTLLEESDKSSVG